MRVTAWLALVVGLVGGFGVAHISLQANAGAASVRAVTVVPARFVGSWETHGGNLNISSSGDGTDHLRAYVNCTLNRLTACDRIIKNEIYPGQFDTFHITKVQGNTAIAGVTNSSYSWRVDTQIQITLKPHQILSVQMPDGTFRYCGPSAPAGACGA